MATSILYLPEESTTGVLEFSYALSADDRQISAHGTAAAALLPAQARSGAVVVLPARAVSWSRLALPAKVAASVLGFRADPSRVRSVIAGALEDLLLDESQRLHFAVFAAEGYATDADTTTVWVATCDRAWLQNGLQALESASIPVKAVVPECEPQDAGRPAQICWIGTAEAPQVVICSDAGVCVLPSGSAATALIGAQTDALTLAEPAVVGRAETLAGPRVEVQSSAERWLAASASSRNLAQLEFSSARNTRWAKSVGSQWQTFTRAPQWRPARWGVVILILVQLAGLNALAWQEKSQLAAQRAALRGLLTQTFPQVTVVIDPVLQMQKEVDLLAKSRGTVSGVDLTQVLPLLVQQSASAWTAMDLDGGQLRVQGSGMLEKDLAPLNALLAPQGLVASLQGETLVVRSRGDQ